MRKCDFCSPGRGLWRVALSLAAAAFVALPALAASYCTTWDELTDALASGGSAMLMNDLALAAASAPIAVGGTATLDLNGKSITCSDDRLSAPLFLVTSSATLTVNDAGGTGTIKGPNGTIAGNGGVFAVTNATLVVNGGTFTNFNVSANGGVVSAYRATLVFAGGAFVGCHAGAAGGAVYTSTGGITVRRGLFAGNSAGTAGSADFSLLNMVKGDLGGVSGGVFGAWPSGFDGLIDTGFEKRAVGSVSVVGKDMTISSGKIAHGTFTFDPASAPYDAYVSLADGSTSEPVGDYWVVSDGTTASCSSWEELRSALEAGNSALLTADIKMSASGIVPSSGELRLDLNGKTITRPTGSGNDSMFILKDNAMLTVIDSAGGGGFAGPSSKLSVTGCVFRVGISGSLTIAGGTFSDFKTYRSGGVILIENFGTVTIAGGTFEDCSADGYGGVVFATGEDSRLTIAGGAFQRNHAGTSTAVVGGSGLGGAVCVHEAAVTVNAGLFTGNTAEEAGTGDFGFFENTGTVTITGGVFDRTADFSGCIVSAGSRRGLTTDSCVVGKDVLSNDAYVRAGTFAFDPTNAPYASRNLIDTSVSSVTAVGEEWKVASTVDDGYAACWTWNDVTNSLAAAHNACLMSIVTIDANVGLTLDAGKTVSLFLNGQTLERRSGKGVPFTISGSASLTVFDQTGSGRIQGYADGTLADPMFAVGETGFLCVSNCVLSGHRSSKAGSVASVVGGELVLTDCTIDDCAAVDARGGAIYLDTARFTMTSGSVVRCSADQDGGAIAADRSTVTIQDVSFEGCTSRSRGGVLSADGCPSLTFAARTCRGNTAEGKGDVLYVADGEATVKGGLFEGGASAGRMCVANGDGGTIYLKGGVFDFWQISGGVLVSIGFMQKYVGANAVVGQEIVMDDDYVRSGRFTFDPGDEIYAACDLVHPRSTVGKDGAMWIVDANYTVCSSWTDLRTALTAGESVQLGADFSVSAGDEPTVEISGDDIAIDLAGHRLTITRENCQFAVRSGGALQIVSSVAGGVIRGGGDEYPHSGSGFLRVDAGGSLTIDGGTFCDFSGGGSFICAEGGTVTLNDGCISNCLASAGSGSSVACGGAVRVTGGTYVQTGGLIIDCTAGWKEWQQSGACGYGGAVYAEQSTVRLTGGTIRRCQANYGGALYLKACASVEIGDSVFKGNRAVQGSDGKAGGGAICIDDAMDVKIESCLSTGNVLKGVSSDAVDNFHSRSSNGSFTFHGCEMDRSDESRDPFRYESGFGLYDVGAYRVVGKDVKLSEDGLILLGGTYSFNPLSEIYRETGICDSEVTCAEQDPSTLLWTLTAYEEKQALQITQAGTAAGTILSEGVYEVNENVTLKGSVGRQVNKYDKWAWKSSTVEKSSESGLAIAGGSTVAIYIKKGCTLDLTGGNGDTNGLPAAPGFHIPSDSALIVIGEGKLVATGGQSGKGADGGAGGNGWGSAKDFTTGYGGHGGYGAGGAGAGIGAYGGAGGSGANGGAEFENKEYYPDHSGNGGSTGGDGGTGGSMGTLYALDAITIIGHAGRADCKGGSGGASGQASGVYKDGWSCKYKNIAGGGGGGGGGGTDCEAADIGGGGGGAGGGGGGGSGGTDWDSQKGDVQAPMGGGGEGGNEGGGMGGGTQTYDGCDERIGGAPGKPGNVGKPGGNGSVYISELADVDGAAIAGIVETHDFLKRKIRFEYEGGTSRGASSSVRDVYLYMSLPDAPIPDREPTGTGSGWLFTGYYTQRNGQGRMYYDGTGAPCYERWTIDSETTPLYAGWREVTPPVDALVVTRLDDEAFDPDDDRITLRAAVTWAMLFPELEGKDGTKSKVTFASSLFDTADDVTVQLTAGQIRVNELRFDDHPLIIAGPTGTLRSVTVDGTGNAARILDIGIDNRVIVSGLAFSAGSADTSGGAINMKGGLLTLVDCTFTGNSAVTSGGAVYLGADGTFSDGTCAMTNVVFSSNAAGSDGGAVACHGRLAVKGARFDSNKADGNGGALFGQTNSQMNVEIATFLSNTAKKDGGAWASGGGIFALNCTVLQNQADNGGGYALLEGAGTGTLRNQFANCTFRQNYAKAGGGICAAQTGSLALLNVVAAHNSSSSSSGGYVDIYVDPGCADVSARGVVAQGTNLSGGDGCNFSSSLRVTDIYASLYPAKKTVLVGGLEQNVEVLSERPGNPACEGVNDSPYRTDITGRPFETCQMGSYWIMVEKPSLVVTTLMDGEDSQDGLTSLREIVTGINGGTDGWTALKTNGVYRVSFKEGISGNYHFQKPHIEIREPFGDAVEIDGGAAEDGSVTFVGNVISNSEFRAFCVAAGTTLRLGNLRFEFCLGRSTVGSDASQTHDGGAIVNVGTLSVSNCAFTVCSAGDTFLNPVGFGGGIVNGLSGKNGAKLTVVNSLFEHCRAAKGGAIYNWSGNAADITGSSFVSNSAVSASAVKVSGGGAIYNEAGAKLSYSGSTFVGNLAMRDGKIVPSDVEGVDVVRSDDLAGLDVSRSEFAVSMADGVMSVSLSAAAAPEIASEGEDPGLTVSEDSVSLMPGNVKPRLYYALGHAENPLGPYTVEPGDWVRADANGNLPQALSAPKNGASGYYKVFVSIDGR